MRSTAPRAAVGVIHPRAFARAVVDVVTSGPGAYALARRPACELQCGECRDGDRLHCDPDGAGGRRVLPAGGEQGDAVDDPEEVRGDDGERGGAADLALAGDGPDERREEDEERSGGAQERRVEAEQVLERRGERQVGDAVGAGDDGVELQRDAQQPVAGERSRGAGSGVETVDRLAWLASVVGCAGGCQRLVSASITCVRKRARLHMSADRGQRAARVQRRRRLGVGREERLDRELGDGDLGRRAERRDRADEAQHAVAAADPQRHGDLGPGACVGALGGAGIAAQLLVQRRRARGRRSRRPGGRGARAGARATRPRFTIRGAAPPGWRLAPQHVDRRLEQVRRDALDQQRPAPSSPATISQWRSTTSAG